MNIPRNPTCEPASLCTHGWDVASQPYVENLPPAGQFSLFQWVFYSLTFGYIFRFLIETKLRISVGFSASVCSPFVCLDTIAAPVSPSQHTMAPQWPRARANTNGPV